MKLLNRHIFIILILSLSLCNCSSDDDMNDDTTPQAENFRLIGYSENSSEYSVSYNNDGLITNYNNDLTIPGQVIYDADNKVIQCGRYSYTYNAQGRISGISAPNNGSTINLESTFLYNNEGLIASQTFRFSSSISGDTSVGNRTYEYNSADQLVSISEYINGGISYTRDLLGYDSNGNVTQVKNQTSSDGINYSDRVIINYTYDNGINPVFQVHNDISEANNFSSIYLNKLTTMSFGNYIYFRLFNYGNNNITSVQRIVVSTGEIDTTTYDYVYNDENFPISAEVNVTYSNGTGGTFYKTWTYETY